MKRQLVMYLVPLAAFLGPFTQTIYTPILPEVREAFAASSFLIFQCYMGIAFGPMAGSMLFAAGRYRLAYAVDDLLFLACSLLLAVRIAQAYKQSPSA
ncbi:hypothetical protein V2J23_10820 [Geobacillus thermoleovorans]|uniref:hypothetical protein n=1 Tax=Geobacillus thermoleovorans TaxID=33941 RepID=UPI00345B5E28